MTYTIYSGSNLDILPTLPDNSVDAIVTDPPYGLSDNKYIDKTLVRWISGERDFIPDGKGFMGKSWDAFVPPPALWDECLRVLKPGGHLLAFFGSRTQDIGALSIRLAGFEIRDSIAWMYGSGFPKSLDISKAIDKAAGAEREVLTETVEDLFGERKEEKETTDRRDDGTTYGLGHSGKVVSQEAITPEAKQWEGWGTALKPAFEPIVVARKPLIGTVAENVLTHGTGGLNIDGSRIGTNPGYKYRADANGTTFHGEQGERKKQTAKAKGSEVIESSKGRWPANVILDPYTAELLDEQSGTTKSSQPSGSINYGAGTDTSGNAILGRGLSASVPNVAPYGDTCGASRFFYVAKASKRDRNEGLEGLPEKGKIFNGQNPESSGKAPGSVEDKFTTQPSQNIHPTVKPTDLMRYLVKLVTPPNGVVLDPFTGSGSTGKAAILEGFDFIGIELTEEYLPIIEGRLKHAEELRLEEEAKKDEALF